MNPVLVLIPAAALLIGPRLWVDHVRKRYAREEVENGRTGAELARELLDRHGLTGVEVERTDIGDHYDLQRRAVRLSREHFEQHSLAAVVTAAHEVGHALQHASGYPPFHWRATLAQVARVTGEVGGVLLIATPLTAMLTRTPIPPVLVGATALSVLGTGVAAQVAALPTEWDASFRRAMPLLEDGGYIEGRQVRGAREMLLACSLTYIAASLAAVLQIWPWLPRRPVVITPLVAPAGAEPPAPRQVRRRRRRSSALHTIVRRFGKPLIRGWYQARMALDGPFADIASARRRAARATT